MPQFNPDDATLPNHGIPQRLLEVFDCGFSAGVPAEFPAAVFHKLEGMALPSVLKGVMDPGQLFTGAELGPIMLAEKQFTDAISGITSLMLTGIPLLRYYMDGNDHTPWNKGIEEFYSGSAQALLVSTGAVRTLDIRFSQDPSIVFSLALKNGTAVHLKPALREEWEIRLPAGKGLAEPTLLVLLRVQEN